MAYAIFVASAFVLLGCALVSSAIIEVARAIRETFRNRGE